ncbi:MAG: glycoside hydrolase family 28 protein [Ignavibacteriaceae bacterium]
MMPNNKGYKTSTKNLTCLFYIFIVLCVLSFVLSATEITYGKDRTTDVKKAEKEGWEQVPEILKKIVAPKFPDTKFNIIKYGAIADGKTLCTKAFEKAIAACNKKGGGIVEVPEGEYITGAIHLKSNVNLHISKGAIVKFSTNPKDYLPVVLARWEGMDVMNYSPLIYSYKQKNIAVTGEGILDGQSSNENWWKWKSMGNDKDSRPRLMQMNDDKVPVSQRIFGTGYYLRPTFIEFYQCQNILISNVTLKNSPFWFLHPVLSDNITITDVTTNGLGPNNDGCDPESSSDILIKGCTFNNGDDCIAIKSGRNNDGRRWNTPSKNIIIQDCKMKDGHGGVVIGSEITGGCRNVYAEDCEMDSPNLDRALRIKSNSKRGGTVKNIYMRNVKVGQVKEAIVKLNMHYDPSEAVGNHYDPVFENVVVENVSSRKSRYGLFLDGLENSHIRNITIKDCKFNGVQKGNYLNYTDGLKVINFYINNQLIEDEK